MMLATGALAVISIATGAVAMEFALAAVDHIAVGVVLVVVMVSVNCHLRGVGVAGDLAKQGEVGGVVGDLFRMAMTADVLVEADDSIGSRHHQMQVVGHE